MVYFFTSQPDPSIEPHYIITGKDKFENDLLIKYSFKDLSYIWFHADNYSSGHIYLRLLPNEKSINDVPQEILLDCLQICKSSSIQGNKLPTCNIIITPWTNLRKSGYMKPGEVSFKSTRFLTKKQCFQRDNKLLNRLEKTRIELCNDVEIMLHTAKKEKNTEYIQNYILQNKDQLIEEERQRKRDKKSKKKNQKLADDFQSIDNEDGLL
ncbi:hypothetical protein TBLA_0B08755 [Henningerozyma blattae CBS 6284]|uniref:NFACT RNA-binding domain-containing protein n=1 Tax=Henningerozyma blattae (strain ATCC 34711 / CBS 6284 / DSM 70876 / NBRC 10599 / NRRL Y-10934 / UCD 77-7) TaxID=1071380 RepID=I2GZY9_HENB6|nr:hypothetical protein TBLA_0B08755 [Tetrapisispora blattae CBS 6284]CCH59691.1 hypothetical protein TBLA_0B08755 [Tetrapisispora blattae CBS 6284]